ncbi:INCENP_ARK-bind domain-containing protein [Psidium guajava]|nr:INCENP_ARK-bind domain-containing protein [Psidium guajava]
MSAMEKLFAQIFERKDWIVDQVRHQTRLFDQHLASTLLIDGFAPPPWLLRAQPSSLPREFRREELITELFEPQPQFSVPYSIGHCPIYDKPVLTADTREFPADSCADLGTLQETGEASSKLPLLHENPKNDSTFVLNGASEADPNITSPQHQRDVIISEDYHDLDQSLARVQRSKARQKALELRNSAKASGSCLHEKDPIVGPSRSASSGVAPPLSENVFSAELVKPSHAISHINSTKETQMVYFKSKEKGSKTSSGRAMRSLVSGSCPNGLLEMDAPCSIDLEVQRQSEGDGGDSSRKEKESNIRGMDKLMQPVSQVNNSMKLNGSGSINGLESRDCQINGHQTTVDSGEITQLRCSSHQLNCEELPGLEISSDQGDVKMAGFSGKPVQSPQDDDCGNGNALVTQNFLFSGCSVNRLGSNHSDQLIIGSTHNLPKAHSTTPIALSNLSNNVDPEKRAIDAAQSSVAFEKPPEGSPFGIPSTIDPGDLNNVPEALASSLCSDSNILLKPKQLDFNEAGENRCCLNNVPGAVLEESVEDTVRCKGLDTLWEQKKSFEELGSTGHLSKDTLGKIGQTSTCLGQDDGTVVSETCGNDNDVIPNYPLQGKTSRMSSTDHSINLSAACKSFPCTLNDGQDSSLSSLKSNRVMNTSHEKNTREFDAAESTEVELGHHKLDPDSYGDQVMPKELNSSTTTGIPQFAPILENVACFKSSDHQSVKTLLVQSEGNGFANSYPQLDKSTELSPASLSLQINPLHSTYGNSRKRKAIGAEDDEKNHISSKKVSKVDGSLNNLMQHNAKHDVTEAFETLQMQQIPELWSSITAFVALCLYNAKWCCKCFDHFVSQGVILERQHENTGSHLVHENRGQTHSNVSGLSDVASVARIEGTMDKEGQCVTEDTFNQTDEEHLACLERPEQNREAHNQRKYECPYHSPGCQSMEQLGKDQIMPVFERFIMPTDGENPVSDDGFRFEMLDVQDGITEHGSVQKLLSKSASVHTPLSHFSTAYKLHKAPNLYKSVPNGLLEYMNIGSTFSMNEFNGVNSFLNKEVGQAPCGRSHSDCLPLSYAESAGYQKKTYTSPVGKLWDVIASQSGSSKEKRSLNPELPCISEENENVDEVADTSQEGIDLDARTRAENRKPLDDITEDPNCPASVSDTENETTRCSLDSIRTEISFAGTHRKAKQKPGKWESSKRHRVKDSTTMPKGLNGAKRPTEVPNNRFSKPKASLRKGGPGISEMDSKRDNIVSHMTSFLPLVQQKQTVAPFTGKRDIKVRSLEAAEATKRQAEKKEIERKMKKEALKLERARLEKENMRQLELQRRRKEEEQKKKLADIAMKKRQREEEEKRGKERKRKRVEGARRNQENQDMPIKKEQQEPKYHASETGTLEAEKRGALPEKIRESEAELDQGLGSKPCTTERICVDGTNKAISILQKATDIEDSVSGGNQDQSYEISPYKCSDDEDEEDEDEDDTPNDKFVPSWASKSGLARAISSQQRVDPDVIFPPDSFCSISEVVMPRKFQLQ